MSTHQVDRPKRRLPNRVFYDASPKKAVSSAPVLLYSIVSLGMLLSGGCENEKSATVSMPQSAALKESGGEDLTTLIENTTTPEAPVSRSDEECCQDPGAIALCWWQDANTDKATCVVNSDCASNSCNTSITVDGTDEPPNGWGLCECSTDEDCESGICTEIQGASVCAPSFCNGYQTCSCFSGCKAANIGDYDDPEALCEASVDNGMCCEGNYPSSPDGSAIGFCSNSCDGTISGGDCEKDSDCTAELMDPYSTDCARYVCDQGICRVDYTNEDNACADNVQLTDASYWGTEVRDDDTLSCFTGICNSAGRCLSDPSAAEGLPCDDDDGNECTTEICVSGVCDHDPTQTVGDNCNADDNACTLDECDATGTCVVGPDMDCDDGNICTYPDTCEDNDSEHIAALCSNPAVNGNAEDYGYTDTEDCEDIICVDGVAAETPTDCSSYNPEGYDLQCNSYACEDGNGEDNCTLSYLSLVGSSCSDGDGCTVGDQCSDNGTYGECLPTGDLDCDDANACTTDTCSEGLCVNTANTGASCEDGNPCTLNDTCDDTGSCVSGTTRDCSSLDDSCTTGVCNTTSGDCEADYLASGTSCDADGNPCTEDDACDGSGNCVAGADKDCSWQDDDCNEGVCNTSSGSCEKSPLAAGTSCDADSDGCTVNDTCDGSGVCAAGAEAVCTPSDVCIISECVSGGSDSYSCVESTDTDCCKAPEDCEDQGFACEIGGTCSYLDCVDNACGCVQAPEGTDCSSDIDIAAYPENCYDPACDASATCAATMLDIANVDNNLCSDLFDSSTTTSFNTANLGYLGAMSQSDAAGTVLSATGSTLCGENNYQGDADENCLESDASTDLGATANDVVYSFTYEAENSSSREEYAYLVKVEADFDAAVYVQNDITGAAACKEGNNPDVDEGASYPYTLSWGCSYPYSDTPMPDVLEETCAAGNSLYDQTCCDPCLEGDDCGYKWCERGYMTSSDDTCNLCASSGDADECEAFWEYPDDTFNCDANKPSGDSYSGFAYMAATVIMPPEKDGGTHKAVIYVDGSGGAEGNFYITVEKRVWVSSPCERANDDARVPDATDVGGTGQTYYDTLENLVNSNHAGTGTTCGGYDCDAGWDGNNSCHDSSSTANEFWPAEAYYNIYRTDAEGSATYCVTIDPTDQPSSNELDAVVTLYEAPGASDICYEDFDYTSYEFTGTSCARNNYQISGEQLEFTAQTDVQYLIGVSRYSGLNRPCLNSSGDDCDFNISIREGDCPTECIDLSDWYSGYSKLSSVELDYNTFTFPETYVDATDGEIYRALASGDTSASGRANDFDLGANWDGNDEVHELSITGTGTATLYFSGCKYDATGEFDGRMALYDCTGNLLVSNNDGCGMNDMAAFSYDLDSSYGPYYLVVDGVSATDNGAFDIAVYYAPTCTDGLQNGTEIGVDCGGVSNGETCPDCPPTCSDGIQNGTETGVDCGGVSSGETCPDCGCGEGRCEEDADCDSSTPYCDLDEDVVDGDGCGLCRAYFVQCNAGENTLEDGDSSSGTLLSSIPLNGGCINMVMADNESEWNETANQNRAMKLMNSSSAGGDCSAMSSSSPYYLSWSTTYCKVYKEDSETVHDPAIIWSTNWGSSPYWDPDNCTEVGYIYGTQKIETYWDAIRIPVRRYTLSMNIYFENTTTCKMNFYVYYDTTWGSTSTSLTCADAINTDTSHYTSNPPTCDPNPPY